MTFEISQPPFLPYHKDSKIMMIMIILSSSVCFNCLNKKWYTHHVIGGALAKCGTLWQPTVSNDQHGRQAILLSWRYALKMPCQHTAEIHTANSFLMRNPSAFDYSTSARKHEKQTTTSTSLRRGVPAI